MICNGGNSIGADLLSVNGDNRGIDSAVDFLQCNFKSSVRFFKVEREPECVPKDILTYHSEAWSEVFFKSLECREIEVTEPLRDYLCDESMSSDQHYLSMMVIADSKESHMMNIAYRKNNSLSLKEQIAYQENIGCNPKISRLLSFVEVRPRFRFEQVPDDAFVSLNGSVKTLVKLKSSLARMESIVDLIDSVFLEEYVGLEICIKDFFSSLNKIFDCNKKRQVEIKMILDLNLFGSNARKKGESRKQYFVGSDCNRIRSNLKEVCRLARILLDGTDIPDNIEKEKEKEKVNDKRVGKKTLAPILGKTSIVSCLVGCNVPVNKLNALNVRLNDLLYLDLDLFTLKLNEGRVNEILESMVICFVAIKVKNKSASREVGFFLDFSIFDFCLKDFPLKRGEIIEEVKKYDADKVIRERRGLVTWSSSDLI